MSIFNKVTKTFQWGDKTVIMETGEIARQASGAVLVNIDDTVVLATVVASKSAKPVLLIFYFLVYPRQAPALGMPLHSRYRRLSRWAGLSSDELLGVVRLVAWCVFCGCLVSRAMASAEWLWESK